LPSIDRDSPKKITSEDILDEFERNLKKDNKSKLTRGKAFSGERDLSSPDKKQEGKLPLVIKKM